MLNKYIVTSSIKMRKPKESKWAKYLTLSHLNRIDTNQTKFYSIPTTMKSIASTILYKKYPSWCWQWLESFIGWLLTFSIQNTRSTSLVLSSWMNVSETKKLLYVAQTKKKKTLARTRTHIKMKRTHERDVPNTCYYWKRWIRFVFQVPWHFRFYSIPNESLDIHISLSK